jgi:hypothetical protein
MTPAKKKQIQKVIADASKLIAQAEGRVKPATKPTVKTKVKAKAKISAESNTPKLAKVAKLIEKGAMTEADLIGAIGEVCRENKMSPNLARALTEAMSTALDSLLAVNEPDTIDM